VKFFALNNNKFHRIIFFNCHKYKELYIFLNSVILFLSKSINKNFVIKRKKERKRQK